MVETQLTRDELHVMIVPWVFRPERSTSVQVREAVRPRPVPAELLRFVHAVTGIEGVRCVVIEEFSEASLHITTFADPMTEDLRDRVYDAEIAAIEAAPALALDFHLRRADEVHSGTPSSVTGQHIFAVWGTLDGSGE
jgi:hypothetical protein